MPFDQSDIVERLGGEETILSIADDPPQPVATAPSTATPDDLPNQLTAEEEKTLLTKMAKMRSRWPMTVRLLERCDFITLKAGRIAGMKNVDPEAIVRVLAVEVDGIVVEFDQAVSKVRLRQVDLVARMGGATGIKAAPIDNAPPNPTHP
ncbi:MAG TPA: hypothetical protein VG710_14060 [Opitutus sp.]|nr:hypothetical protein [Opitutus sp.]